MIKRLKNIKWQYALGELLLIFLGITLAMGFNNWNEGQKQKRLERKTLIEIRNGIEVDLQDIRSNVSGFKKRTKAGKMLYVHLKEQLSLSDSLKFYLPYLKGTTQFINNTTPYETLKSRGFELIRNDSLRLAIMHYYDVSQDWIKIVEAEHVSHYQEYVKPFILNYFSPESLLPNDYASMMKNKSLIPMLHWSYSNSSYMLELYEDIEKEANNLTQRIDTELLRW
ncbi:MAG: hypothetical protein IPJ74_05695 [Saprospiraceae bacterium]|nr:hypothetical protein [Saprospiraceae bacterium]